MCVEIFKYWFKAQKVKKINSWLYFTAVFLHVGDFTAWFLQVSAVAIRAAAGEDEDGEDAQISWLVDTSDPEGLISSRVNSLSAASELLYD